MRITPDPIHNEIEYWLVTKPNFDGYSLMKVIIPPNGDGVNSNQTIKFYAVDPVDDIIYTEENLIEWNWVKCITPFPKI